MTGQAPYGRIPGMTGTRCYTTRKLRYSTVNEALVALLARHLAGYQVRRWHGCPACAGFHLTRKAGRKGTLAAAGIDPAAYTTPPVP